MQKQEIPIDMQIPKIFLEAPFSKHFYKIFSIPKSPSGEKRIIEAPIDELKNIQRALIPILNQVPLHPCAFGLGGKEKSTLQNAACHNNKVIIKMDIKKFFPSTDLNKFLFAVKDYKNFEELKELSKVCFIERDLSVRLPTGAPTSPILSGIAFTPVDYQLNHLAKSLGCNYTRYMDDLTFSANKYPQSLQKKINNIVRQYGYTINHDKSMILYKDNHPQVVTGVCINGVIPGVNKKYRKKLRAELDHYARDGKQLDNYLNGKINYIYQINTKQATQLLEYFSKRQIFWAGQQDAS